MLEVVNDSATRFRALGRDFQEVVLLDTRPGGCFYPLLVDLADGRIEDDVLAVREAEARARLAQYGRLAPSLYQRLQELKADDVVPVAVWVAAPPGQALEFLQQQAFAQLASRYPEAREALDRSSRATAVPDSELARRMLSEYAAIVDGRMEARIRPLVAELESRGFEVFPVAGLPAFTGRLPRWLLEELAGRPEIAVIYLAEARGEPALDSAIPTIRAPAVWSRGLDGAGKRIAIVERGNVYQDVCELNLDPTSRQGAYLSEHATHVASCAASHHPRWKGSAPQAVVISAGHMAGEGEQEQRDFVEALRWALVDKYAHVANVSERFFPDVGWDEMEFTDMAVDYLFVDDVSLYVCTAPGRGESLVAPAAPPSLPEGGYPAPSQEGPAPLAPNPLGGYPPPPPTPTPTRTPRPPVKRP